MMGPPSPTMLSGVRTGAPLGDRLGVGPGGGPDGGPGGANEVATVPAHENQPLGQTPTRAGLDAATWAGQSLMVALVLAGVALVAYAIKRRQLAKAGGRIAPLEPVDANDEEPIEAPVRAIGFGGLGGLGGLGAGDAMRDEIAALRNEIESMRDEGAALRREVASLRALVHRDIDPDRKPRGETLGDFGGASRMEPKPTQEREGVEQRVLAMAARGETIIAIAQKTGVPTGQVELMINLARASGRA